ncbi:hypothetical protein IV80_GL001364 [Pediococcus cellicola]|uniref:Lipoyl-binding domain-containing protein n=1 Tax=Pediococcus cellicola TaxID=319652 RepID=A0A0R2INM1_9LACO|nr:hypothetical protein IV80_GL001364 [Pediococcus cellicola]
MISLNITDVDHLLDKLEKMNFSEVDLEFDQVKIHVKKEKSGVSSNTERTVNLPNTNEVVIKSPMVGVVHLEKQLKAGKAIKQGEVVAQIESMKLFNDVTSTQAGTIATIHVKNGDPVAYDQPLMTLVKGNQNV